MLYIAITNHAVSLVLVRTDDGVQKPIYYINKSLQEAEVRYLPLEKAVLASIHATRKVPHYNIAKIIFQNPHIAKNFKPHLSYKWSTTQA